VQPTSTEPLELENLGSLITIKGTDSCLGYLMWFDGKGIYCPSNGEVSRFGVTKEHADAHNKALDEALLRGLDENCQIGQRGTFYLTVGPNKLSRVTTFCGTLVSDRVSVRKTTQFHRRLGTYRHTVTFHRGGKVYRGSTNGFNQLLNFKRIK
jgi:hypothetical protein